MSQFTYRFAAALSSIAVLVTLAHLYIEGPVQKHIRSHDASRSERERSSEFSTTNVKATYGKLPLQFEKNDGQSDSQIQFRAQGSGYGIYLTASEAVLAFPRINGTTAWSKKVARTQEVLPTSERE